MEWKSVLYTLQNWTEKETEHNVNKSIYFNWISTVCSLTSVNPRRPSTIPCSRWRTPGRSRRSCPAPPASTSGRDLRRAWRWQRQLSSPPPSPPPTQLSTRVTLIIIIIIKCFSSCRQIICQILTTTECLTMATMSTISMFRYGVIKYFSPCIKF